MQKCNVTNQSRDAPKHKGVEKHPIIVQHILITVLNFGQDKCMPQRGLATSPSNRIRTRLRIRPSPRQAPQKSRSAKAGQQTTSTARSRLSRTFAAIKCRDRWGRTSSEWVGTMLVLMISVGIERGRCALDVRGWGGGDAKEGGVSYMRQ